MIRRLCSIMLTTLVLTLAAATTAAPAMPTDAIAKAVRWEIAAKGVPSIAIALVDRNGLVWTQAWGSADAEHKNAVDAGTVYRAGSVSKLLTDTAIMRLVELGKLDLDSPVSRYLPSFHPHNPYGVAITLRQLMAHRSGLVREPPRGNYFQTDAKGQADAVLSLNDTTLVARPGSFTKYSNAGVAVVGEVLARATGKTYEQAVRNLVLAPLGMSASSMTLAPVHTRLAYSEMASFDGPRFAAPAFDLGTPAAGNLYTTTGDLARFATSMLDGGSLLRQASIDEMWRVQYPSGNGPRNYGLGFIVGDLDGQRMAGYAGAVYGFSTELRLLPEAGIGAIVFSTVDSGDSASKLVRYALQAWVAARAGSPVPAFSVSVPVTGDEAKRLSGRYSNGTASVSARIYADQLAVDGPEIAGMVRSASGHYLIEDAQTLDGKLAFAPDASWLELDGVRYRRDVQAEPPEPATDFAPLIGQYGWDHNILLVYERDGQPYIRIEWVDYRPLHRIDADTYAFPGDRGLYPKEVLHFDRGPAGESIAVTLNGIRWPRRDFGAEMQAKIRQGVSANMEAIRSHAMAAKSPRETPKPRQPDLVTLDSLDPSIKLDIRYADNTNFMGVPLHRSAAAYMQRAAAEAVVQVSQQLSARGYGLLVHDAYRPWFVTKMFWDATPPSHHQFVADPSKGSRHNRGSAVDLTMYNLATGKPIVTTGRYDEMSSRSYSNFIGGTDHQRWLRDALRQAMEMHGFAVYPEEWWHFDYSHWAEYPIGNSSFEQLRAGAKSDPAM